MVTILMAKTKETPGTVVFQEVTERGKPPIIKTLYVQKWFAAEWQAVKVTIEEIKGAA